VLIVVLVLNVECCCCSFITHKKATTTFSMTTYYLIPYRDGKRIGEDVYPLLLEDDTVRRIHPEKLKEWTVEVHCGSGRTECVACQKYIHDKVKFANDKLYLIYDAKTNTLSHNTRYNPFTGLSFRNNDDEDWANLPREFELILHKGMQLSFNLPADPRRWWYSMDSCVAAFEEETEDIVVDIDFVVNDDVNEEEDDDDMVEEDDDDMVEEEEHNNRSVVLLSDNDADEEEELPQLADRNGCDLSISSIEPLLGPRTPCNVQEASRNPINDNDVFSACDRGPQKAIPIYAFLDIGHNIASMAVAVQPSLDPC
jgi:hypothetical protein